MFFSQGHTIVKNIYIEKYMQLGPDGQIILDDDEETETAKINGKQTEAKKDENNEDEDDESVPAPQVTIGADGQIVLNEARYVFLER